MSIVIIVVLVVVVLMAAGIAVVRLAKDVPEEWHVDPLKASKPSTPNSYRVGPVDATASPDDEAPRFAVPKSELATAFDAVALGENATHVLAGSADSGHVTYVQRSALFGFPDYVSVKFLDADDGGSTLVVFSRSRFGQSDLGVNKKRVVRWLDALGSRVG